MATERKTLWLKPNNSVEPYRLSTLWFGLTRWFFYAILRLHVPPQKAKRSFGKGPLSFPALGNLRLF